MWEKLNTVEDGAREAAVEMEMLLRTHRRLPTSSRGGAWPEFAGGPNPS
jgi:hypothetical protein